LHLAGEFTTASLLIAGGFGLLTLRKWGYHVFLLALGILLPDVLARHLHFFARQSCLPMATKGDMIVTTGLARQFAIAQPGTNPPVVASLADVRRRRTA